MEIICKRFPIASKMELTNLDDQSLYKSKQASRKIAQFIENERFYWIRIIQKHKRFFGRFEGTWKEVIRRIPIGVLKKLIIAAQKWFKIDSFQQVSPLHVAAQNGDLDMFSHIISKSRNKNPEGGRFIEFHIFKNPVVFKFKNEDCNEGITYKATPLHIGKDFLVQNFSNRW